MASIVYATCIYKLTSKFSIETYQTWAANFLTPALACDVILYTNKETLPYIEGLAATSPRVQIVLRELEEFTTYKYKSKWIKNQAKNTQLAHVSWELIMLWAEKVFFVQDAAQRRPDAEWLGWCDIGYFRNGAVPGWPAPEAIQALDQSKIHYLYVCQQQTLDALKAIVERKNSVGLPADPIPTNQVSVAGGFFTLHVSRLSWYAATFDAKLALYFKHKYLIKDDQIIVVDCVFSNPAHFKLWAGDWFDFRRFFAPSAAPAGVSILIPIYNGIEFLITAMRSVQQQTYKSWEVIIGVNGHEPDSEVYRAAVAYQAPNIKVLDLRVKGKVAALNAMVEYAAHDWIALLDVDDMWLATKLEKQAPYMSTYDVIGTHCRYFGQRTGMPPIPVGDLGESRVDFRSGNPIINSSCLIKKKHAFWIDTFRGVEDYAMWLRLWRTGARFFNVAEPLVLHRIHAESAFNAQGNGNSVPALLEAFARGEV